MGTFYKTIVVSDIHLGYKRSKVSQLCKFLGGADCSLLILNGDIFDAWRIQKKSMKWRPEYTEFIKIVMRMTEERGTEVIYIGGNHDAFIKNLTPLHFSNITVRKEYILESGNHRYFITHGDMFDRICTNIVWLSKLGDLSYRTLAFLNRWYDKWRDRRGKPRYPFATKIRRKVKETLSSSRLFETMTCYAKERGCDGFIYGHTHRAMDEMVGGVRFLNSGDWIEAMTALTETADGTWELLKFDETQGRMRPIDINGNEEIFRPDPPQE